MRSLLTCPWIQDFIPLTAKMRCEHKLNNKAEFSSKCCAGHQGLSECIVRLQGQNAESSRIIAWFFLLGEWYYKLVFFASKLSFLFQVVSIRVIIVSVSFFASGEFSTVIIFIIIICLDRLDLQTWNVKFQTFFDTYFHLCVVKSNSMCLKQN